MSQAMIACRICDQGTLGGSLYCPRCGATLSKEDPVAVFDYRFRLLGRLIRNRFWLTEGGARQVTRQVTLIREILSVDGPLDTSATWLDVLKLELNRLEAETSLPAVLTVYKACLNLFKEGEPANVRTRFSSLKLFVDSLQLANSQLAQKPRSTAELASWLQRVAEKCGLVDDYAIQCIYETPEYWLNVSTLLDPQRFAAAFSKLCVARAKAASKKKNYGTAQEQLELALQRNPHDLPALIELATIAARQREIQTATKYYVQAAELGAVDPYVYNNVAWYRATTGRVSAQDLTFARYAVELAPIASCLDTLSYVALKLNRYGEAVAAAREALYEASERKEVYRNRLSEVLEAVPRPMIDPPEARATAADSTENDASEGTLCESSVLDGHADRDGPSSPNRDLEAAADVLDDEDLVLGGSGEDSDIALGGDSGISLVDPADSGLSLEEPLDLAGEDEESLELGEDDMLCLDEDDSEEMMDLEADDEFNLTPLDEVGNEESRPETEALGCAWPCAPPPAMPAISIPDNEPAPGATRDAATSSGVYESPVDDWDTVECSVFAPPRAMPGDSVMVQVWAHLREQSDAAAAMAVEFDEEAQRRGHTKLATRIARESKLTFELRIRHVNLLDTQQDLIWRGEAESVQFDIEVPEDSRSRKLTGQIHVMQNDIPIGRIVFKLEIVTEATTDSRSPQGRAAECEATRFKSAFISYASQDREKVLPRVQMLKTVGIQFFQDVLDLDPGVRWERELYRHIDDSDVLLLFWSTSASQSDWVKREWMYALEKKGDEVIRPVIIERPPVPPPTELQHLHFNDRVLYLIDQ